MGILRKLARIRRYGLTGAPIRQDRLIVSAEKRLVVGFTPKAACTVASKLFFHTIGKLDEARDQSDWIHDYREVYCEKNPVRYVHLVSRSFLKIKFVRNPFHRAVSSYIHAMRYGYVGAEIERSLRLGDFRDASFRDFVRFLTMEDLHRSNVHHDYQKLRLEGVAFHFDHIVRVENILERLSQIKAADGRGLDWNESLLSSRHHTKKKCGEQVAAFDLPFKSLVETGAGFPDYSRFYDPQLLDAVYELYKVDFDAYGYARGKL
ncbi:MAG: sulfotransferase family 2 domain-containing protein [Chromatiales bacterium]|nr:sulfotransferase family 2 domain-containing protein [Chromatiales bacterium]